MQAVIGAAFLTALLLWCLMRAGPLYVSMFKPLAILFSTVMGVIIFGDGLFLGKYGLISFPHRLPGTEIL